MNDVLKTSKQLATACSISTDQLRQLKHKNSDRFIEGTHYIKDDSGNLWTVAGESLVRDLLGINDPVATDNASVLEAIENCLADLLASDAIPQIEPLIDLNRIKAKAIQLTAQRLATKLKNERLEQWRLVSDSLHFSPAGVAGSLPSSEVSHD